MTFSFHPEAEKELFAAVNYYEDREPGLGFDFLGEVATAIAMAVEFPGAWPIFDGEVRRCLTHRFPFGVLYLTHDDELLIVAVMHLHRDPDYWKSRET